MPAPTEWPAYGRDAGGSRFAPVDQVNRGNVSRLQVAFDSSDAVIAFALP